MVLYILTEKYMYRVISEMWYNITNILHHPKAQKYDLQYEQDKKSLQVTREITWADQEELDRKEL